MAPTWAFIVLALLGLQRIAELAYNARNVRRLRAAGAVEVKADGYAFIVAVHATFFVLLAAELAFAPWSGFGWWTWLGFGLFAVGEALRAWSMLSLKGRWSTRVFVMPGAPLVATGPYRFLRHPIYVGVCLELAGLPLAFGLWGTLVAITLLNALALSRRIRAEDRALRGATA